MADRVKEYAYSDENKETSDVINLLLLGWVLLGLVVYILGSIIATQLRKRKAKNFAENSESPIDSETTVKQTAEFVSSSVPNGKDFHEDFTYKLVQIPVCSGNDSDVVHWLNNVFAWMYNQRVVSPVFECWMISLNTRTRMLSAEHGILVSFQNVTHCNEPTIISNVLESKGSKGIVHISCDAEVLKLVFLVVVTQVKEKDTNVYSFVLKLHRLAGELSIDTSPEDSAFFARFAENPQIEFEIEPDPFVKSKCPPEESEALRNLISEIASEAFSSSTVDLRFSTFEFSDYPKFEEPKYTSSSGKEGAFEIEKEEKLLVKIIRADNLGGSQGTSKPYCIVEMDDPAQHFETVTAESGSDPVWDESFLFTCKSLSAELLFELYDKDKPPNENFLGLGIVSIEELLKNPSQRQIITLQSRPLENDNVTGTLTAEFLFPEYNVPSHETTQPESQSLSKDNTDIQSGKIVQTNSRVTAGGTIITTTTIKRTNEDVEDLTNTALKELEKSGKPSAPNKSTLIIHSVQRTDTSGTDSLEASPASHPSADSRSSNQLSLPPSPSIQRNGVDRSRPKEKRSLLGNLRKKLSFRKTRSKSMELRAAAESPVPSEGNDRSVSSERAKSSMAIRDTASLKSGHRFLAVPGSTRSSFSEASGLSAASSRTYINENSTLVVEINENGIVKRFLIPTSMIHRSKWKKKGTKLHLYNDHVFVAKHLSGYALCQVCRKRLARRPGKQGYECRDCNLQCHKSCHVKVAEFCPNSSVTSMEVEYIHDPRVTKPKSA